MSLIPNVLFKRQFVLMLVVFAFSVPLSRSQDVTSDREEIAKAKQLFMAADFDKAISILEPVLAQQDLESNKTKHDVTRWLARCYDAKQQWADAESAYVQALRAAPPTFELSVESERLWRTYWRAWIGVHGTIKPPDPPPDIKTIAILDFRNSLVGPGSSEYDNFRWGFADMMSKQLEGCLKLLIVERERISHILDEIGFQRDSDIVDQQTAVRVGKIVGAHLVVFGSYIGFQDDMRLHARVVIVETGVQLVSEDVKGEIEEFDELTEELAVKICKGCGSKVDELRVKEKTPTRSLDAWKAFTEARFYEQKGQIQLALEKYQEAAGHDPEFVEAKEKIERLKPISL